MQSCIVYVKKEMFELYLCLIRCLLQAQICLQKSHFTNKSDSNPHKKQVILFLKFDLFLIVVKLIWFWISRNSVTDPADAYWAMLLSPETVSGN